MPDLSNDREFIAYLRSDNRPASGKPEWERLCILANQPFTCLASIPVLCDLASLRIQVREQEEQISAACSDAEVVGYYGEQLDSAMTCFREAIRQQAEEIARLTEKQESSDEKEHGFRFGPWRCSHCNAVFTDRKAGIEHFGDDSSEVPACSRGHRLIPLERERQLRIELEKAVTQIATIRNGWNDLRTQVSGFLQFLGAAEFAEAKQKIIDLRSPGARSMIVAYLTPEEYRRFEEAHIPRSGSTGAGAKPKDYGGLAPYIATFRNEFDRAIEVLGWKKISLEVCGECLIVRSVAEEIADLKRQLTELLNLSALREALEPVVEGWTDSRDQWRLVMKGNLTLANQLDALCAALSPAPAQPEP